LSNDAKENKKAKRGKKNTQVAQESDNKEEEDDHSFLSEGGPHDDDDNGEEEPVDVVNEEQISGLLGSHSGLFAHKTFSSAHHSIDLSTRLWQCPCINSPPSPLSVPHLACCSCIFDSCHCPASPKLPSKSSAFITKWWALFGRQR